MNAFFSNFSDERSENFIGWMGSDITFKPSSAMLKHLAGVDQELHLGRNVIASSWNEQEVAKGFLFHQSTIWMCTHT